MAHLQNRSSLAGNFVLLLLLVVGITVTVVSVFALFGVFQLSRDEATARQSAYRQATVGQLSVRLDSAVDLLGQASRGVMTEEGQQRDEVLDRVLAAGVEHIDRILLMDTGGAVLTRRPLINAAALTREQLAETIRGSRQPVFVWTDEGELWAGMDVSAIEGQGMLAVRVRTGWVQPFLNGVTEGGGGSWIALVDRKGSLVATSSVGLVVLADSMVLEESDDSGAGQLSAIAEDGTMMSGSYASVGEYPGLDWRVVIAEPRSAVVRATFKALAPAATALVLSSVFSVVVGVVFARRLVAPIQELEAHAREAVRGGFIDPIATERTDELGSLADAFNAVAVRLNALRDLSQLLASSRSLDQVLDGILSAVSHIVGSSRALVYLLDDDQSVLRLVASRGFDAGQVEVPVDSNSWLTESLFSPGPREFTADAETIRHLRLAPGSVLTGLAAPLRAGDRPVGVVAVLETGRRSFTGAEHEMMKSFSAQAAVAVRNSQLFALEATARTEAETFREAAEVLVSPIGLDQALENVVGLAKDILDVDWAGVAVADRGALGLPAVIDPAAERVLLKAWAATAERDRGAASVVLRRGENPFVDDLLTQYGGDQALLATAIRGGTRQAVLGFVCCDAARTLGEDEKRLAEGFATQVSLALDNAYNFERARARAANLETVFRISQAVGSSLQVNVVLNRVLDVVQKIFSADAVSLMRIDESGRTMGTAMARGLVSQEMVSYTCRPGDDIPGTVCATGEPVRIDDLGTTIGRFAEAASRQQMHSALAVPLRARGRSLGVLTVFATDVALYTAEDMELLHTFASQAALALDTASLYSKEHLVASVLQESILPEKLPDFPELETSAIYLPVGEEADIGGDYYDVFRARDGSLVLAIGDVCGKGVVAATKTSMIKYTVRGLAAAGLGPAHIMAEVNRMVAETGVASDIVTLWLGELDARTGRLVYANGGHPAAQLHHSSSGETESLGPTGPLLGAVSSAKYSENSTSVEAGDLLLLYTDGVTEARRGDKFFGEGRVRRALSYGGQAADVTKRLLAALARFVPGQLRDDAAMLAVRVRDVDERRAAG